VRSDRQDQELPELYCPNVLPEPKETKRECEKRKRKAKERVVRLEYRGKPVLTRNRRDSSGFGGFMVYTYVLPLSDPRRPSLPWIWTCRHPRHSGSGGGSRTRFASSVCLRGTCSFSAPGPNPTWPPPSPVRGANSTSMGCGRGHGWRSRGRWGNGPFGGEWPVSEREGSIVERCLH
jgi:hypothetical protein